MWDKKIRQSCDTPIIQKNFAVRTFLTNRRVRPRCFPLILDKQFPTEKRDTPFFAIIFSVLEIFWNTEGFSQDVFRRRETKNFRRKKVTTAFLSINFFRTRTFLKYKGFPTKFSGTVRLKLYTENRWTPLFCIKFLYGPVLMNHCRVPQKNFGNVRQKQSTESWYHFYPKKIWYQNNSETQKISPTEIFGDVTQKSLTKSWYHIIQEIFGTRTFPKHKSHPTKFFDTVRQKQSTESWYHLCPKTSDTRVILKHRRVHPHCFLAMWGENTDKKTWHLPRSPWFFPYLNFSETQMGSPRSFSVLWD